jgi:hypothetical protein
VRPHVDATRRVTELLLESARIRPPDLVSRIDDTDLKAGNEYTNRPLSKLKT